MSDMIPRIERIERLERHDQNRQYGRVQRLQADHESSISPSSRLLVIARSLFAQVQHQPDPARILKLAGLYLQILQQEPNATETIAANLGLARIEYQWGSSEKAAALINRAYAIHPDYPGLGALRSQILAACLAEHRQRVIEARAAKALQAPEHKPPLRKGLLGRLGAKPVAGQFADLSQIEQRLHSKTSSTTSARSQSHE